MSLRATGVGGKPLPGVLVVLLLAGQRRMDNCECVLSQTVSSLVGVTDHTKLRNISRAGHLNNTPENDKLRAALVTHISKGKMLCMPCWLHWDM